MAVREMRSFDYGWRFHRGGISRIPQLSHMATYHNASAESGRGGAAAAFDDLDWEIVDLPHDSVIQMKPEPSENEDHGYIHRDDCWYRNYFYLPETQKDNRFSLVFDGVATECIIWVNGVELKRNFTAGISFEVDFTDVARFGNDLNVVSVYVDNSNFEGWYYEGGGLYRHVWLLSRNRLSVEHWGVHVCPTQVDTTSWETTIKATISNASHVERNGILTTRILDAQNNTIGLTKQPFAMAKRETSTICSSIYVINPKLWSPSEPTCYTLQTTIEENGTLVDDTRTVFGFRTLRFDPACGMLINGELVKIKGMCVHQEHGGLGVAIPDGVLEYRIRRLQEMGCNAIRTAHNPPAPQLLDICDHLGMLVMDENRWLDSSPEGMKQLESLICRDRNHPCVVMWSMFNEESAMEHDYGIKIMNTMRARVHQLDASRPVTYAQNAGLLNDGVALTGDIIGINYNNNWYPILHKKYPETMLFGAETIGYINGRLDEPMTTWQTVLDTKYHGGIFAWTGFDYRGEAHWPDTFFRFGAMDPSGCSKDGYHLYQAYWTSKPCIHIATTWKNDAAIGSAQTIRIYTNGVEAELFADLESLGRQQVDPAYQTKWAFSYRPCTLTAVSYDKYGNEIARCKLENPQKPVSLTIRRETQLEIPKANARDVAIFNIWAVDEDGCDCDRAENELLSVSIEGPVKILCVGDGDVRDYIPWGSFNCRLRRGHCQLILRTTDRAGKACIRVESEHLGCITEQFEIKQDQLSLRVLTSDNPFISFWLRSSVFEDVSDPILMLDKEPVDWLPCYTSDCAPTPCSKKGGCVGFYSEATIPVGIVPSGSQAQIIFELNEHQFALQVEAPSESGIAPYREEIRKNGTVIVTLPKAFTPGMPVRIKIGMVSQPGESRLALRHDIRWHSQKQ